MTELPEGVVSDDAKRLTRLLLAAGVVLFWIVQLTLLWVAELPLLDSILLGVLLVVVPAFSLAQLPLIGGAVIERMPAYWSSIITLWFLGTASWFVGTGGVGAEGVGLVEMRPGALLTWSVVLTAVGMGIILLFRAIGTAVGATEAPLLRELLPRTGPEKGVFAILSVAAGVGEELAYRGYAITTLAPLVGTGGAVAITSTIFGVVHGYQGVLGMARTGIMGAVLAWGFLASGSLWPPMVAHILIDLLAGIVFGESLMSPEGASGVEGPSAPPPAEPEPWT